MLLFLLVILGMLAVVAAFFMSDLLRGKGEFGLDVKVESCSKCGFRVPLNGDPERMEESGVSVRWVCPVCGEKTKSLWGKVSPAVPQSALPEIKEERSIQDFKNPLDEKGRTPVERVLHDHGKDEDVERDEY